MIDKAVLLKFPAEHRVALKRAGYSTWFRIATSLRPPSAEIERYIHSLIRGKPKRLTIRADEEDFNYVKRIQSDLNHVSQSLVISAMIAWIIEKTYDSNTSQA